MKNNKKVFIIVGFLIFLFLSLIIILVLNKKNILNSNPSSTTKEIELDPKNYAPALASSLSYFNNCNTGYKFDFGNKDKIEYNDLSTDFIYNTVYNYLYNQNKIKITKSDNPNKEAILSETNYIEEEFSLDDFLSAYQYLYGIKSQDIKYENSFKIGQYIFTLNNNKFYTKKTSSPNCFSNNTTNYLLVNQKLGKDFIEITYIVYYSKHEYADNVMNEYAVNIDNGEIICKTSNVNSTENINKLTKYSFTFIKKGNNYIFNNITKSK